ncbi:unnamed protein product [Amoebophrya sp. A25]|nr:unnamed protein product [Amoebophrya sp. A25]|eukprot:GSA25T00007974001.1
MRAPTFPVFPHHGTWGEGWDAKGRSVFFTNYHVTVFIYWFALVFPLLLPD